MSTKKSAVKKLKTPTPETLSEEPISEPQPSPESPEPQPEVSNAPTTNPPLTLESLHQELESLKQLAEDHTNLITQLQETLAHKRKPVSSNGKVQIKDKQTGMVYPSKNNAYQTLLKSGELKDLVDKGIFGDIPEKNTFGWYALVRELPDRFEEVKPAEEAQQ
ncbi:MAG TPA: hypothetical protein G4O11_07760 [Anaerolineae bacterium]|nr:hypothetical protein [Anaerolineae bacterium]